MDQSKSYLVEFVESLKDRLNHLEQQDWSIPEPPPEPPSLHTNYIEWRKSERRTIQSEISVEELRTTLPVVMTEYLQNPEDHIFLVNAAAGGGKTYGGVTVVQNMAREGRRILWAASRHDLWNDIARLPHFDRQLWHHWLPMHKQEDEFDLMPTTCRYADSQRKWSNLGYQSMRLCEQLCMLDGHIKKCPYRLQGGRKEPIIFGMHQHLASGMAISDFDLVIVDELPLSAFVDKRKIPTDGIMVPGATGPIKDLLGKIYVLTADRKKIYSGKELFDQIGPLLGDCYAQVEFLGDVLPQVPRVAQPEEVNEKPYWFVKQLLDLCAAEYMAWKNGWPEWVERVKVNQHGLYLLSRSEPWVYLPNRIVVLDATATPGMYRQIFRRPVRTFKPHIKREGNVYQVTGRLNGTRTLIEKEKPTKQAGELLAMTQMIGERYEGRIGVICPKKIRPFFEREYGDNNVEHFHNLRGTNSLEDVECLFVVGNPAPDLTSTINTTAALNEDRIQPFGELNDKGYVEPLFYDRVQEYTVTEEVRQAHGGKTPWRKVKGFWSDPDLHVIYEAFRESELIQAVHRARPNVSECDVWVFTSTPIGEPLDGIWNFPPIGPDGMYWKTWLKLEPWLTEQWQNGEPITTRSLADATGVGREWVSRKKWLEAIAEHMPDKWETALIPTGARPAKGIRPFIREDHELSNGSNS